MLATCVVAGGHDHDKTIKFIENKGQYNQDIKFKAKIPDGQLLLSANKLIYAFAKWPESVTSHGRADTIRSIDDNTIHGHVYSVSFLNSNPNAELLPKFPFSETYNYFKGSDESKHTSGVKAYNQVYYKGLYKGIDFRIYEKNESELKYDFIVSPKANPDKIKLKFEGTDSLYIKNGHLYIKTSLNTIIERKPYCYQYINGVQKTVWSKFKLDKGNVVSFEFPKGYDPNNELIIDPKLVFSTFSGSTADNWGSTAAFDRDGNTYSAGIVFEIDPDSVYKIIGKYTKALQFNGGEIDIAIFKFDPTGENLIYATFIGGNDVEFPHSLNVTLQNELIIAGTTGSSNFPVSGNAFDKTFNGGTRVHPLGITVPICDTGVVSTYELTDGITYTHGSDIFLTKLSPDGTSIIGSTYLGGSNNDGIIYGVDSSDLLCRNYGDQFRADVVYDVEGNVYLASHTSSRNFPVKNSIQTNYGGGLHDAVIVKMKSDLSEMIWGTYFGGSNSDAAYSIKLDSIENVFFAGGTNSSNIPLSRFGLNKVASGNTDGFVASISNAGTRLISSTYIGTPSYDQVYFLDLDDQSNVYVFGQTLGSYPVVNADYKSVGGQFIHKLSNRLDSTYFSFTFGSGRVLPNISPTAFLVNDCQNIYVAGWGGATNKPGFSYRDNCGIIRSAFHNYVGGNTFGLPKTTNTTTDGSDFYVGVFSKDAKSFVFGDYIGGTPIRGSQEHVDGGTSRFDKRGYIYQAVCAGCGSHSSFPTTPNAWSNVNRSDNCNNAVFKYDMTTLEAKFDIYDSLFKIPNHVLGCLPFDIGLKNRSFGGIYFEYLINDSLISTQKDSIRYLVTKRGTYDVKQIITDLTTCSKKDSAEKQIHIFQYPKFDLPKDTLVCLNEKIQINIHPDTNFYKVNWSPSYGVSDPTSLSPKINPLVDTKYIITLRDSVCVTTDTLNVKVKKRLIADFEILDSLGDSQKLVCDSIDLLLKNLSINGETFKWRLSPTDSSILKDSIPFYYTQAGSNSIRLIAYNPLTCNVTDTAVKAVQIGVGNIRFPEDTVICVGESVVLQTRTDINYSVSYSQKWKVSSQSNDTIHLGEYLPDSTLVVTIEALNNTNQCRVKDSLEILVKQRLVADFDYYSPKWQNANFSSLCLPATVFFNDTSNYGQEYKWIINGFDIVDQKDFSRLFLEKGFKTVKLVVTDSLTCQVKDSVSKDFTLNKVQAQFPLDTNGCTGDEIVLTTITDPANTVVYSPNYALTQVSHGVVSVSPKVDTSYIVKVSDGACELYDTVRITTKPELIASFDSYTRFWQNKGYNTECDLLEVRLKNTSTYGQKFFWDAHNGFYFKLRDSIYTDFIDPGTVLVTLIAYDTRTCNPTDTFSAPMTVNNALAEFPKNAISCEDSSVTINVIGNDGIDLISWSPAKYVDQTDGYKPIFSPPTSTTFRAVVLSPENCTFTDTIHIRVKQRLIANFDILDPKTLKAQSLKLCHPYYGFYKNKSKNGTHFEWFIDDSLHSKDADGFVNVVKQKGEHIIQLYAYDTATCNPVDSATKSILSYAPHLNNQDVQKCYEDSILVRLNLVDGKYVKWIPSKGVSNSTSLNPLIYIKETTRYLLRIIDSVNCIGYDTLKVNVLPSLNPLEQRVVNLCERESEVKVLTSRADLASYLWKPGGETTASISVNKAGVYSVFVRDVDGCKEADTIIVNNFCDPLLQVPDVFTPNGDGINDEFVVYSSYVFKFKIVIYDRWGEVIFYSEDMNKFWDGTFKNQVVMDGVYNYEIHFSGRTPEGEVSRKFRGVVLVKH